MKGSRHAEQPASKLRTLLIQAYRADSNGIEEYARHNGHADLIREAIDGTTGD